METIKSRLDTGQSSQRQSIKDNQDGHGSQKQLRSSRLDRAAKDRVTWTARDMAKQAAKGSQRQSNKEKQAG